MMGRTSRPRLMLVTGLGLGLGLATAATPPARAAEQPVRARRAKTVVFAPLFDVETRFTVKEKVELRFRARDAMSGDPVRAGDLSISLRHGENGAGVALRAREVKPGVFAVRFKPAEAGQYFIVAAVHAASTQPESRIPLGVEGARS